MIKKREGYERNKVRKGERTKERERGERTREREWKRERGRGRRGTR